MYTGNVARVEDQRKRVSSIIIRQYLECLGLY